MKRLQVIILTLASFCFASFANAAVFVSFDIKNSKTYPIIWDVTTLQQKQGCFTEKDGGASQGKVEAGQESEPSFQLSACPTPANGTITFKSAAEPSQVIGSVEITCEELSPILSCKAKSKGPIVAMAVVTAPRFVTYEISFGRTK